MNQSTKTISPLRQRMIEDMMLRKLGLSTQTGYLRAVVKLNRYLGRSPDTATAEDLRLFQLHMVQQGDSSITINATLTGLKFFFENTLDQPNQATAPSPEDAVMRTLPQLPTNKHKTILAKNTK